MRLPLFFALALPAAFSCIAFGSACSSESDQPAISNDDTDAQHASDVTTDASPEAAALPYPAFPADMPTVKTMGGPLITSPNVVAIFDPNEPNKAAILAFLNSLEGSSFWTGVTSEYGIGPIVSVTGVDLPTAMAPSVTSTDLVNLVASEIQLLDYADAGPVADNDAGDAGVPRTDTIFMIFTPPTTTISNEPCTSVLGYHNSLRVEGNVHVPFGVTQGACTNTEVAPTQLGVEIEVVTHELVEAATDPFPFYEPAYYRVDDDHLAWAVEQNSIEATELNDLCNEPVSISLGATSYKLANVWSNREAQAGKFPCVPSSFGNVPMLTAAAMLPDEVPFNSTLKTKGITLDVGKSATIDVHISSSAPMPNPFTISAVDVASAFYKQPPQMTLVLDQSQVQNGDVVHLTITRTALSTATSVAKGAAFSIRPASTDPSTWFAFNGFVADP
ncbi:MAG: hypothetical protein ABI183_20230 [Polyangiaceae bacterium]